jgi:PKD repeat protein
MHDFRGSDNSAGIGSIRASGSINIYDNVMWNISPYMQIGSEENNTLGPDDQNVSNWVDKGYGYGSIDISSTIIDPSNIAVASFTCSATSGSTPFRVDFNDTSTGTPTVWSWDFGDMIYSTEQNPTHTYFSAGNYTVRLTVSNANGTDSKLATITVLSKSILPVFPGYTNPTTDQNHDGHYEDINGNGMLDFDDVVVYYDNMDWIGENASVGLFDYNNNILIDFDDIVKLYDML